jgi:hypothetical protein
MPISDGGLRLTLGLPSLDEILTRSHTPSCNLHCSVPQSFRFDCPCLPRERVLANFTLMGSSPRTPQAGLKMLRAKATTTIADVPRLNLTISYSIFCLDNFHVVISDLPT